MNTEKIMEDIQSVQDNIREIKSTWGNTIMTLDNIKSGLKADVQKKVDEAYQRGLNDAWEAVKKIALGPEDGALNTHQLAEIFGTYFVSEIIRERTAQEVIDKIKAYEDKHSDRIEVGDEVEWAGDKYVVTYLNYNIETSEITDYDLLAYDGSVVDHVKKCAFTKTGKHYDIASILEAMRE